MPERRTCTTSRPRIVRDAAGKPKSITGYAAVYFDPEDPGTEYQLAQYGTFEIVERLLPGCFDRAIREDDVRALFNHNPDNLLGRNRSGTLRLSVDAKGLRYEIDPPDTQTARDLMASMARGDVSGSSFSFDYRERSVTEQRLPDGRDRDILEVRDVKLFDVGPVTFPAYTSTSAEARRESQSKYPTTVRSVAERAEQVERDLADLDRRLKQSSRSLSRRTKRERLRQRAAETLGRLTLDEVHNEVVAARELMANC